MRQKECGRIDEWIDGWIDGWVDGWIDGWSGKKGSGKTK
jgi:hypothetical protein